MVHKTENLNIMAPDYSSASGEKLRTQYVQNWENIRMLQKMPGKKLTASIFCHFSLDMLRALNPVSFAIIKSARTSFSTPKISEVRQRPKFSALIEKRGEKRTSQVIWLVNQACYHDQGAVFPFYPFFCNNFLL